MKNKLWILGWFVIVAAILTVPAIFVYDIDPYMHYHKPDTDKYFYSLTNQRSQNDGMTKHFDYDAMITGSSMIELFSGPEMDSIFGTNAIKACYFGATYKEINDNLKVAVKYNPNLKTVIRGLDMGYLFFDKDRMRTDLGNFPDYLYDSNPLNDYEYVWNREVIWNQAYKMLQDTKEEWFTPGVFSFDVSSSLDLSVYGKEFVHPEPFEELKKVENINTTFLTESEMHTIKANIEQNVTSLPKENPDIQFYYFIPPYSIAWWYTLGSDEAIKHQIEGEEYAMSMILECDNIHLYSYNTDLEMIADLNNYRDSEHYGAWINSAMLQWMHDGVGLLTKDNYKAYIEEELDNLLNFDYESLNEQTKKTVDEEEKE